MRFASTFLLVLLVCDFPQYLEAQWCNYSASIGTSKDFCVGSTLKVISTHTLQTIIWYKDGQPVDTIKADQYLDPNGTTVAGGHGDGNANNQVRATGIAVDDAGNVFVFSSGWNIITKWAPRATAGIVIADGTTNPFDGGAYLYLDQKGQLYAQTGLNGQVLRFSPGASKGTLVADLGHRTGGGGMAVDCDDNIYLSDGTGYVVEKFAPGSVTGVVVAGGHGEGIALNQMANVSGTATDQAGNLFIVDGFGRLQEWTPGATTGIAYAGNLTGIGGIIGDNAMPNGDILVTGDDTIYSSGMGSGAYDDGAVLQWTRGSKAKIFLGGHGNGTGWNQLSAISQMTIDIHGNFYVCDQDNRRVQKFTRTSIIDPTFTPTGTGKYYAAVKDFRGYTVTTDTVYINDPQSGPPAISITATDSNAAICVPITFTAQTANTGAYSSLQWEVSGVKVGNGGSTYTYNLFADSDQVYCILAAQAGCSAGLMSDTSNIITLHIDPHGAATVSIRASQDTVCSGTPVKFTATVTNGAAQPTFQWQLNGVPAPGDDSASYESSNLQNGDVVFCQITSDDACGLAKSNSIPVTVDVSPVVAPGQIFTIKHGASLLLEPEVSGTITSWLWTPGTGLSDSTIENPVASPPQTTTYLLKVTSAGCPADSATILVDVFTPLSLPGAFTPNGDGHNDRFYVLGGPVNSEVERMEVFNRWGQLVFGVQHAAPGDARAGWDGRTGGSPAPAGTYVYIVVMRFAGGGSQVYKGTVVLIR